MAMPRNLLGMMAVFACQLLLVPGSNGEDGPVSTHPPVIDAQTLQHKVMCGYQGWFRCPGDAAHNGWLHWSRNRRGLTPKSVTFEMWPEMSEYKHKYPAPGFSDADGKQAHLFSSADPQTVALHFRWMKQSGIDGVFVQRFLVNLGDPSFDRVLEHVRASAAKTGRVYAVGYDLTGTPKDRLYDLLTKDWKRLVDELKITEDDRYLHHNGRPVLFVWGFFSDRFSPELAGRIIDFLKSKSPDRVTLIGGCQWWWRTEKNAEWSQVFRRFDIISPWNVGNVTEIDGQKQAATDSWKTDISEAEQAGMEYLPVIYPGFSWMNLKGKRAAIATIPRLGGKFFWRQFVIARELDLDMAYVAMFDEVDEGTAIFKVSNTPPIQTPFVTYEGLPSDWYLRLTGEGSKLIRRERKAELALPISP